MKKLEAQEARPIMVRIALVSCWMILAGMSAAAGADRNPDPALTYRVVDVAADDTLNVRDQAGTSSPVVAGFRSEETGIVVTGVTEAVNGANWWEVVHAPAEGKTGWVNARFLAPDDDMAEPAADFPLQCVGTEPFWSLEVADGQARYASPEGKGPSWRASEWVDARGLRAGFRFAVRLEDVGSGAVGWAAIARAERFCSDGMSDRRYPYDTTVITPAQGARGRSRSRFFSLCWRAPRTRM